MAMEGPVDGRCTPRERIPLHDNYSLVCGGALWYFENTLSTQRSVEIMDNDNHEAIWTNNRRDDTIYLTF